MYKIHTKDHNNLIQKRRRNRETDWSITLFLFKTKADWDVNIFSQSFSTKMQVVVSESEMVQNSPGFSYIW